MPQRHSKSTDSKHEVKLTSRLIAALGPVPASGLLAGVPPDPDRVREQRRAHQDHRRTEGGKDLDQVSDVIRQNRHDDVLDLPEGLEMGDKAYVQVELAKNGCPSPQRDPLVGKSSQKGGEDLDSPSGHRAASARIHRLKKEKPRWVLRDQVDRKVIARPTITNEQNPWCHRRCFRSGWFPAPPCRV